MPVRWPVPFRSSVNERSGQSGLLWLGTSFVFLSFLKLWLVSGQTLYASCCAIYDDRLFLNIADHLLKGQWLGPYDQLTLVKGMFYPLWVAATSLLGIPLVTAQHLLYILASAVLVIAVRPLLSGTLASLLLLGLLLFNPMSYTDGVMAVSLREGIYPALTMLTTGCAAGSFLRCNRPLKAVLVWPIGLGISLSALWLTREEGIWIMPYTLTVFILIAVTVQRAPLGNARRILLCLLPLSLWLASLGIVAGINKVHYGIFTTAELKSPGFLAAYGALTRIKHAEWQPTVPVPKEVRLRAYEVSPAFAELKPFLEPDIEKRWAGLLRRIREQYGKDPVLTEQVRSLLRLSGNNRNDVWARMWDSGSLFSGEIHGGWFVWAFRDAVAAAGHHKSGSSAADYYRRFASEINTACRDGRLECLPERSTMMSPWHSWYAGPLVRTFLDGLFFLVRFEGFSVKSKPSEGDPESVAFFRKLTHERLFPPQLRIRGWAFSPGKEISFTVRSANGDIGDATVTSGLESDDVFTFFSSKGMDFPVARRSRFELSTYCTKDCFMYITSGDRLLKRLPLNGRISSVDSPELHMYIDSFDYKDASLRQVRRDIFKSRVLESIGTAYQFAFPVLGGLGLALYVAAILRAVTHKNMPATWVLCSCLLVAILTRLFLMSVIHVSSFPGISTRYLSPVYPLVLMFVALSLTGKTQKMEVWTS